MRKLKELIKKLNEYRKKMIELKLWLERKEVIEYNKWKQENPKDRAAMEKVIAALKINDKEWLEKEEDFLKTENKYKYYKNIYDVILKLLEKDIEKEEIEEFLSDLI